MRALLLAALATALPLCGALSDPYLPDEVSFARIDREHFDALGVVTERGPASDAPLVLRVALLGDGADADLGEVESWLRERANIELVVDPAGAPLYLTRQDLAATSGRGTLGATVKEGMAAEVRDMRIGSCVVAHEVLHFAGLKHVEAKDNIMYAHCAKDFLQEARLEPWQRERLDEVRAIRATTLGGVVVWASR